jgi:hypothetical protein
MCWVPRTRGDIPGMCTASRGRAHQRLAELRVLEQLEAAAGTGVLFAYDRVLDPGLAEDGVVPGSRRLVGRHSLRDRVGRRGLVADGGSAPICRRSVQPSSSEVTGSRSREPGWRPEAGRSRGVRPRGRGRDVLEPVPARAVAVGTMTGSAARLRRAARPPYSNICRSWLPIAPMRSWRRSAAPVRQRRSGPAPRRAVFAPLPSVGQGAWTASASSEHRTGRPALARLGRPDGQQGGVRAANSSDGRCRGRQSSPCFSW